MQSPLPGASPSSDLARIVEEYRGTGDVGTLLDRMRTLAARLAPEQLAATAEPFRDMPEVVIPAFEHIVAARPADARSMVILANAYWLTGRGPDVVGSLAARAIECDPANRGAWHLWALAESDVRARVERWRRVTQQFPSDQLARAALADNATSLAGAEHDPAALELAITTYESLLVESRHSPQRTALESTLAVLRGWRL
jgi:hypothetical protein